MMAGISCWQFYCRLVPGAIRTPQVLKFLKALRVATGREVLIAWDRLRRIMPSRCPSTLRYIVAASRLNTCCPKPSSPIRLSPSGAPLRHLTTRNHCSSDGDRIKYRARRNLCSVQRRSNLVLVFLKHKGL